MKADVALEIKNLIAAYGNKTVLENIDFWVEKGSFTSVIGRNGSGKSTLLSCTCGCLRYKGEIKAFGRDLKNTNSRERVHLAAHMPQSPVAAHIRVRDLLEMSASASGKSDTCKCRVENAIKEARLEDLCLQYLDRISGGELRRAYLGMILAQDSEIFLLDEADANLDADNAYEIFSIMKNASKMGKTVIFVTHDLTSAVKYSDNLLVIDKGKQTFFGTTEKALEEKIIEKNFRVKRIDFEDQVFFTLGPC